MNLLGFYDNTLQYAGLHADDEGFVYVNLDPDERHPANLKIDGNQKRLLLPTAEHLKNTDWEHRVIYHPLRENVMHGESKVIEYLRKSFNYRVNLVFSCLAELILKLACEPHLHGKLSADATKLMSVVKDADEKTLEAFEKIVTSLSISDTKSHMANIYLRKLGKKDGKQYFCLGIWTFPFLRDLKEAHEREEKAFHGVKLRKKDWTILINLLEAMMPGAGDTETVEKEYRFGSEFQRAPFLDALLRTGLLVTENLNKVWNTLFGGRSPFNKDEIASYKERFFFDHSFLEVLNDVDGTVDVEVKLIPVQPGNDAPKQVKETFNELPATQETVAQAPAAKADRFGTVTANTVPQAQAQATPSESGGVTIGSMMGQQAQQMGMMAPQMGMVAPNMGMMGYPQMPQGYPQQPVPGQMMFQPRMPGQPVQAAPMYDPNIPPWVTQQPMQQVYPGMYPNQMMQAPQAPQWNAPVNGQSPYAAPATPTQVSGNATTAATGGMRAPTGYYGNSL